MDLNKRLSTLKSAWGLLSGASVLFPGALYLLNLGSIKTSQLGPLYPATAVPLSALALLIVLLLLSEKALSRRSQITRALTLTIAVLFSIVGLIGFIYFSTRKNDQLIESGVTTCYEYDLGKRYGDGYITEIHRYAGRVTEVRKPCVVRETEPAPNSRQVSPTHYREIVRIGEETKSDIGMDPIEYYSLTFFDLCFIALTASFAMLSLRLEEKDLY